MLLLQAPMTQRWTRCKLAAPDDLHGCLLRGEALRKAGGLDEAGLAVSARRLRAIIAERRGDRG